MSSFVSSWSLWRRAIAMVRSVGRVCTIEAAVWALLPVGCGIVGALGWNDLIRHHFISGFVESSAAVVVFAVVIGCQYYKMGWHAGYRRGVEFVLGDDSVSRHRA